MWKMRKNTKDGTKQHNIMNNYKTQYLFISIISLKKEY